AHDSRVVVGIDPVPSHPPPRAAHGPRASVGRGSSGVVRSESGADGGDARRASGAGVRLTVSADVTDNRALSRFELPVDGQTAFLSYERTAGSIRLLHTEVPEAFRGRGFGETLVKAVVEGARAEGVRIVAVCPFVRAYLRKHAV